MISQDNTLSILKDIEKDTNRFKSAQPFYNGQYGMKLITNSNTYDSTVSTRSSGGTISGYFQYVSNSQINPFCSIIAELSVNGSPVSVSQAFQQRSYRLPTGNNKEVQYHFQFSINLPAGTVVQVKGYAIASDNGSLSATGWSS